MKSGAVERLKRVVRSYTEAVQPVRELDTSCLEYGSDELFDSRRAVMALDTGLVFPSFIARLVLTHDPYAAEAPAISAAYEELEKIDAISRAADVVATVHREGFAAAQGPARQLATELRLWSETALELPELQPALLAYRADPLPVNEQRLTR